MTSIHRSALVEYSDQQMFDLVNAIEHYPEFMPGCVSAKVLSQSSTELVGQLSLSKAGISQQFTTRNQLVRPQRIEMKRRIHAAYDMECGLHCDIKERAAIIYAAMQVSSAA